MANSRHFKFINSKTGNAIFHYTYTDGGNEEHLKKELEKIKVTVQNGVFTGTIYWEEVTETEKRI